MTGILDPELPLPKTFKQVAANPAEIHDDGQQDAVVPWVRKYTGEFQNDCRNYTESHAAPETDPGFLGGYFRSEFLLSVSESPADGVCADVREPDEDEETEQKQSVGRL